MLRLAALVAFGALPAAAQQGIRAGDETFDVAALTEVLAGHSVEFHDDSIATYNGDGSYSYVYAPGDLPNIGTYRITDGSAVCVTFENGFSRCDTYVRNGARLILIIERGDRFPVRDRRAN